MIEQSIYEDVNILLSLKKLIKYDVTASEFLFMYLIQIQEKWKLSVYNRGRRFFNEKQVLDLIERGYLEIINNDKSILDINNLRSTELFQKVLNGNTDGDVEEWINEWYDLWPKGIKTGGYYLRADKFGALAKMKAFLVTYPMYGKDIIMNATKNYLTEQSIDGYKYTKLAPYFINKNGLSVLNGECEAVLDGDSNPNEIVSYGDDEL